MWASRTCHRTMATLGAGKGRCCLTRRQARLETVRLGPDKHESAAGGIEENRTILLDAPADVVNLGTAAVEDMRFRMPCRVLESPQVTPPSRESETVQSPRRTAKGRRTQEQPGEGLMPLAD